MYLLRFLEAASTLTTNGDAGPVGVEYRLACSGEFYNRRVETFDWRKSDITRVLLREPFELFVASQPFDSYPQELCMRLKLAVVTEQGKNVTRTLLPDEDIVEDLCSVLTLLSRRLVSQVCKTRQSFSEEPALSALGSFGSEFPAPILPLRHIAAWNQRPITVLTSMKGQKVIHNNPPPVGVDPTALSEFLLKLPNLPELAGNIVYASRLYKTALELIETRPDIAYLLLISTVESLAKVAFTDYDPGESSKLATPQANAVQQRAKDFGLDDDQAKQLGIDACKGNPWLKRKFKRFLEDFISAEELAVKDTVFLVPDSFCAVPGELPKTFGKIYDARSANLHQAVPFPNSVGVGMGTSIPWQQLPTDWPFVRPDIPPVAWFERTVSHAINRFLAKKGVVKAKPFTDYATSA